MDPITKFRRLTFLFGPMDPYEAFQPKNTVTLVTSEANNVPLNPPQTRGFQAKKTLSSDRFGPIEHLVWTPSPNLGI